MPSAVFSCAWFAQSPLLQAFHDHEWGEPVNEPGILFEYLVLHSFQIGFDFPVVLGRREAFREYLAGFDPVQLARFGEMEIEALLENPRIIRNRRKLEATVQNARAWLQLQQELGGEDQLLPFFYAFVGGEPLNHHRGSSEPERGSVEASIALSKELKRRGFSITGPATCYNIMQTAGLVNDHRVSCPQHDKCRLLAAVRTSGK
jgi:DNA-3-methyladenine glycosylase I